jgi:hypothetical protein
MSDCGRSEQLHVFPASGVGERGDQLVGNVCDPYLKEEQLFVFEHLAGFGVEEILFSQNGRCE